MSDLNVDAIAHRLARGRIVNAATQRAMLAEIQRLQARLADVGLWPECAECGCTDAEACLGGCSWVLPTVKGDPLICSMCAGGDDE